jgi:hypothetical protein
MLEQLKRTLVESYVGAIAMGWLLTTAILDFVSIFSSPVQGWVSRNEYRALSHTAAPVGLQLQEALPELIKAFLVLLIWYFLFRWLYLKPTRISSSESAPHPEQLRKATNS